MIIKLGIAVSLLWTFAFAHLLGNRFEGVGGWPPPAYGGTLHQCAEDDACWDWKTMGNKCRGLNRTQLLCVRKGKFVRVERP